MEFYKSSFWLKGNIGNNEFSLGERTIKTIEVARFVYGHIYSNLKEGNVAFCEIEDSIEHTCTGLKEFVGFDFEGKNVYVFDNHNHSFFFTAYEQDKHSYKNLKMIHIDQHKDMRRPNMSFEYFNNLGECERRKLIEDNTIGFDSSYNNQNSFLDRAYEYGNIILNVGNYIVPLLESNIISDVYIVDSLKSLQNVDKQLTDNYFLNIDLDFFSKDMEYISFDEKINIIKAIIGRAKFVTISTSPYFVDLSRCITALKRIFE